MFQRDTRTHAIINTDDSYYKSIIQMRQAEKKALESYDKVSNLEKELAALRDMVNTLVTKGI